MLEIYECDDCEYFFTEPDETEVCLESLYGVHGDFRSHTYSNLNCCPRCKSIEIHSIDDTEYIVDLLNRR